MQRSLIFSISPKCQHRVYLSNIQKHCRHFVQIDFYSWTNHRIPAYHCFGPAFPNNPSPKGRREPWERGCPSPLFTALASRKERDDFQPRPQGFSLKKWVGPSPGDEVEGKALGTRLDDFSSLKHVLSEPHTTSSQSHIFLLPR